jgi:3-keto-disaccharide hydrolase
MPRTLVAAFALLLLAATTSVAGDPDEKEWIPLFNGKDLTGWIPKITGHEVGENYANTFRVEDGLLKVSYDQWTGEFDGRFGHLFYEKPFSYYVIAVEYRFVGEQMKGGPDWAWRNSGIMIHGQPPETMQKDQDFPICIEAQLLGGPESGERPTANLCTPATNVVMGGKFVTDHCVSSTSPTYRGDQWVRVEVEVHGDGVIRHFANGKEVLSYEMSQVGGGAVNHFLPSVKKDGQLLSGGSISLQAESHPVEFRKVELLPLEGCTDQKATNYKSYYLKSDPAACVYP